MKGKYKGAYKGNSQESIDGNITRLAKPAKTANTAKTATMSTKYKGKYKGKYRGK